MPKPANNPAGISYEETSVKFSNVDVFYQFRQKLISYGREDEIFG